MYKDYSIISRDASSWVDVTYRGTIIGIVVDEEMARQLIYTHSGAEEFLTDADFTLDTHEDCRFDEWSKNTFGEVYA